MTPKDRDELADWLGKALGHDMNTGEAVLQNLEAAGLAIVPVEATEEQADRMRGCDMLSSDRPAHSGRHWYEQMYHFAIAASPYRTER